MTEPNTKILVVEDEAVVLFTLELILRQHGYDVKGARDANQALLTAQTFHPEILLCDINLPDLDGIQVAIRVKETLPQCRVVLLSGEISSNDLLEEAKDQGYFFEVLAKPTDPQQLLKILSRPDGTPRDPTGIHRVK
jgi:CheY-like chemotaxis protein